MIYLSIKAAGSVTSIFARDYVTFVIGRLIAGIGSSGSALAAFVTGGFLS